MKKQVNRSGNAFTGGPLNQSEADLANSDPARSNRLGDAHKLAKGMAEPASAPATAPAPAPAKVPNPPTSTNDPKTGQK